MEELKRFQGSTFHAIARRKLVEDRDPILELTSKIQELQNELNCLNDSRYFQDAESIRSENSPSYLSTSVFPTHTIPGAMLSRSFGMPSRRDGAKHLGHAWYIGKRFCKSRCVLYSTLIRKNWIHGVWKYQNRFTHQQRRTMRIVQYQKASPDRQPKILPSLVREILQRIMEQTNNDCRFRIFILTNFPYQQRLLVGR